MGNVADIMKEADSGEAGDVAETIDESDFRLSTG